MAFFCFSISRLASLTMLGVQLTNTGYLTQKTHFGKLVFVAPDATKHYSVPKRQNTFFLILVKNEIGRVSGSMRPLLSRSYTIMTMAGLERPQIEAQSFFSKHLPMAFTIKPRNMKPLPNTKTLPIAFSKEEQKIKPLPIGISAYEIIIIV